MEENNTSTKEGSVEGAALGPTKVALPSPVHNLLDSILLSAQKLEVSCIHLYSSAKSTSCYFEIAGKLEPTGKKFNDKVLIELIDYIKKSANLEESELVQVQTGNLEISGHQNLTATLLNSPESKSAHLILGLEAATKPKAFEDLGFWGKTLEQLESVLDSRKGVILVDSLDQYALRTLINSSIDYLNRSHKTTSVSFDSSQIHETDLRNHDRIFTKLGTDTAHLFRQVLSLNPSAVAFIDPFDEASLDIALEYFNLGSLVFITSSEGSASASAKRLISVSSNFFQAVDLIISLAPIQTIKSSNGSHPVSTEVINQIEGFFGLDLPESWRSIYAHAGIGTPDELLNLNFPVASEYSGLTNLVEIFSPTDYIHRSVIRNSNLTASTLNHLAVRSGMITKRQDGLIKALRKEVDLADVIEICK